MSNGEQITLPTGGPGGLRTKLVLGFVGLLAILIAVGVESITLLSRLGGSIDVILRENYKSVIACERMKESLERMDSGALFALAGHAPQGIALARENSPKFEAALATELGNITLPGEGERAQRLRQLFAAYAPTLERVLDPQIPLEERRALYFQKLFPTFQQIKGTADEILQMNQQNMVEANDRARALATRANRRMAVLLLLGTAFAGVCVAFLSRSMLGPLERLTRAARQIEGGDLDLTVPVTSRDELGQLAAAFNSMAGGLRELRESDQAHLLRARRVAERAIDNVSEAVAVVSADQRVELANRAAARLGLRPGEPIPAQHGGWLPPLLKQAEAGRAPERSTAAVVHLPVEGRERFYLPRVTVLDDRPKQPESFILVLEDMTDRRHGGEVHAGLLANVARDLEAALRPLRSVLGSLREAGSGPLTQRQEQLLARAGGEAERLDQLATNLQAISSLEERRQQLHPEPAAPWDLIDAAVQEIAARYRAEQVELAIVVDPEAPRVLADRERVGVVLSALLNNALAHTAAGGKVTVHAEPHEGRARFSVVDTGDGIPPAHIERLFEPFYQVPGTQDLGGVGLGLAIAKEIVQSHGGEIHCESEGEGRGATFWFTLPAAME
ncbi:MAG TPA: ATP-binding protein [Thermoanaerobaculia bacterium]|nr:ATP-binding protein [Thermoanaerobaculia bacterium]